jgi:hypothetical protein
MYIAGLLSCIFKHFYNKIHNVDTYTSSRVPPPGDRGEKVEKACGNYGQLCNKSII